MIRMAVMSMSWSQKFYAITTFVEKGRQLIHLGGLLEYSLGDGKCGIDPLAGNPYMYSGIILSFRTPKEIQTQNKQ